MPTTDSEDRPCRWRRSSKRAAVPDADRKMESAAIGGKNPGRTIVDRWALRPLFVVAGGTPSDSAGGSLHMPPEAPDAVANPIGSNHGIQGDLKKADPRFAFTPGFLVRTENLSAHPETAEDVCPVHFGPVEDFGATAQLNRRRRSLTLICSIRMWARLATRPGWRWLTGGPPRPAPEHRRGPGQIRG